MNEYVYDAGSDPEIVAVLPQLNDTDPAVRRIGLRAIEDLADEHPEIFVQATHDTDAGVRLEAAHALEGIAAESSVDALVDLLTDPDERVRCAAGESLAEMLDPRAGLILLDRFPDTAGEARAGVLAGLRKLRLPGALQPALVSLADHFPQVRREAVGVLGYLRHSESLSSLCRVATTDPQTDVRLAAVGALAFAGNDESVTALLEALRDCDWQVREAAAISLGKLLLPESIDGLITALSDSAWEVRVKAANALGKLRADKAVAALSDALRHPVANLRKEAVSALNAIGCRAARPALTAALEDQDVDVRKTAARAIDALSHE